VTADPDPKRGRGRWILLGILLFALAVRLGWGLSRPATDAAIDALPDQRDYLSLAQNLLKGQGLAFVDNRFDDVAKAFRTPGYPIFLSAFGANVRLARSTQALLDTSTVLAIYILAQLLILDDRRRPIGLLASAIVAVNPFLIYFSALLLTETLFTAMLAWGIVLLVLGRGGRTTSLKLTFAWLAGAVLLTLSILVRPSALAVPLLLGYVALWVNRKEAQTYEPITRPRWPIPVGATMLALIVLTLLPWAWRNFRELGTWVWLDTNSGFTLYDGYNPDATGASDQSFVKREPVLQTVGEIGRSEYLSNKAFAWAREHPLRLVQLAFAKLGRTWSPVTLSSEFGQTKYRLVAFAYSLPLDVLVLLGLATSNLSRSVKILLLSPAIYFSIVHAATIGSLRYRIPAEPPMAVLAAAFLVTTLAARDTWRRSPDAQ
jgi:4-amino-4-deoxy-L-arabinose transferase-like glycosyltransferase